MLQLSAVNLQKQQSHLELRFISLSFGSTDVGRESNQEVIAVVVSCLVMFVWAVMYPNDRSFVLSLQVSVT